MAPVDPETVVPETDEPEAVGPETDEPEADEPEADEPEADEPEAVVPGTKDPHAVVPETADADSRRRPGLLVVLAAATVIVGSFGIWAATAAHSLRAAAATANSAVVDPQATRAVEADVTRTVNTIFSYSYADTARTRASAQRLLTGRAISQYNQLFALVQRQAPKEKLIVTTKVTDIGVELLTGGRARLLVFANQQDTRAGTGQTSYSGAMFAVTAINRDGHWLIENIDTFTS